MRPKAKQAFLNNVRFGERKLFSFLRSQPLITLSYSAYINQQCFNIAVKSKEGQELRSLDHIKV